MDFIVLFVNQLRYFYQNSEGEKKSKKCQGETSDIL